MILKKRISIETECHVVEILNENPPFCNRKIRHFETHGTAAVYTLNS